MEQIPEIVEASLNITINKRYRGEYEVSVFYSGEPLCRYTVSELAKTLLNFILDNIPLLGLWLFSKRKRKEMVTDSYNKAIEQFVGKIKSDVAKIMFDSEARQ
uniref:Uncharacterized protein n=1 Tax=viral metagenome TaxID=1070528 RepID=A0A6H1ZZI4_9ZZZZ